MEVFSSSSSDSSVALISSWSLIPCDFWCCRSNFLFYGTTDPLIGEAAAARLALSKVADLKLSSLFFQGDSASVMECILLSQLQGSSASKLFSWKIASLILSLHPFLLSIPFFYPSKIPWADNLDAHSLAAWRLPTLSLDMFLLLFFPTGVYRSSIGSCRLSFLFSYFVFLCFVFWFFF